jgi:hypothetical protein
VRTSFDHEGEPGTALMVLSQHVWDAAEQVAWLGAAEEGLEGSGPKEFLYLVAENDAQVPNLSSDIAVRLTGIPVLASSVRKPWGAEVASGPVDGSAFVSFNVGDSPVPEGNVSPENDDGGHGAVAFYPAATEMIMNFLFSGQVTDTCSGECDFTE